MDIVRRIKAILTADASQFDREVKGAAKSVESLGDASRQSERLFSQAWGVNSGKKGALTQLSNSIRDNGAAWDEVSNKSLIAGGAIAAGLGLATKAAIDWESAFAGVRKTVDDTEEGYAALEQELRDLATVLPATQGEIAGVAEAAGQLGVQRENITEFTRVMIDLGESTNLSAEEAATGLARFANVMGTSLGDVDRLGSVIVGLGNNFATTEREILDMSSRLSGAGRQANLTEGDVLGIATALSSVGIEAEAGGTAFSRVMVEIGKSVDTGNEKLETFARVAGLTATEFQALWQEDAGEGLQRFIAGLGDLQARGESLEPVLAELGMTDIRVGDALRRSASSSDVFTRALAQGNEEWEKNNALTEEAAKRYETAEAQLAMARNQITNAAIDAGSVLAPILVDIANVVADTAGAFADLPTPVQRSLVSITGLTAASLLFVGGGVKAIATAQALSAALTKVGASGATAAAGVNAAKTAAAGLALALGAIAAAGMLIDPLDDLPVEELTEDLLGADDAVASFNDTLASLAVESKSLDSEIRTLGDALKYSLDPPAIGKIQNAIGGLVSVFSGENTSDISIAGQRLSELDAVLAGLVSSGSGDQAAALFEQFAAEAVRAGYSTEEFLSVLPEFTKAQEQAAGATKGWADEANRAKDAASATAEEIQGLADAMLEQYDAAIAASNANIALEQAYTAAIEAATENGRTAIANGTALDIATEAGQRNQSQLNSLASQALATAEANLTNGAAIEEVTEQIGASRGVFVDAATKMGLTESAANQLADQFGLTSGTATTLKDKIGQIPSEKTVRFTAVDNASSTISYIKRGIDGLQDKTVTVRVARVGSTTGGLVQADGGVLTKSRGGLVQAFASGGMFDGSFAGAQPQIRPYAGPRGVLWGEEGSGPWEAFISGHPQKLPRSRSVADEVVQRLGGRIEWVAAYANGGIRESSNVANYYSGGGSVSEDFSTHFHGPIYPHDLNAARRQARRMQDARYNSTRKGP